jgi:hypothetical protein
MIARAKHRANRFSADSARLSLNGSRQAGIEDQIMLAIKRTRTQLALLTLFLFSIAATMVFAQEETRQSVTTQYSKAERDNGVAGKISVDEFEPLITEGGRLTGKRSQLQAKASQSGGITASTVNHDFWFYTADVVLFNDHDGDGHFYGIDLLFDADTYFAEADVYAVVYLSLDGGPWNEYSATDNFTLFGTSADDEYVIVTELVSGYPTGSYDLLIELFDAYDDNFVASYGPIDTSELAFLPLEDSERDTPFTEPTIVIKEGGGSLGLLSLLALLFARRSAARRSLES